MKQTGKMLIRQINAKARLNAKEVHKTKDERLPDGQPLPGTGPESGTVPVTLHWKTDFSFEAVRF